MDTLFPKYHTIIRRHLDIPDEQIVICGMSIGYADLEAIENTLETEREPLEKFTRYFGF